MFLDPDYGRHGSRVRLKCDDDDVCDNVMFEFRAKIIKYTFSEQSKLFSHNYLEAGKRKHSIFELQSLNPSRNTFSIHHRPSQLILSERDSSRINRKEPVTFLISNKSDKSTN